MAQAAYLVTIKSSGTPTVFLNATTTNISGNVYQINATTRRILDPNTTPAIKIGSLTVTTGFVIDYLFGLVTFTNPPTGAVSVSGRYMPVTNVGGCYEYSLDIGGDMLDKTDLSSTGYRSKQLGMNDVSITLSRYDDLSKIFKTSRQDRENVLIEIRPDSSDIIRGWFVIDSTSSSADVSSLESESITLQLAENPIPNSTFSWR